jgi:hypothetical protein
MGTSDIQANILYSLGEGVNVADATSLGYALRWANAAYRNIFTKYRFKHIQKRSIFRTANGQQTYQAPSDFLGFLTLKDETNDTVLQQLTPEEFARVCSPNEITDETFESDHDVAVSLDNVAIVQYSETVADDTDHTNVYTRDTDYEMDYINGTITVLSTGTMADATDYYIDYLHYDTGSPDTFCLEYDATNKKYVFRLDPAPDATYIASLVYPAGITALSGAVDPIWSLLEYCLERGGIYFGALELLEGNDPKVQIFKSEYDNAILDLVRLDSDLVPKAQTIPIRMRKTDYQDAN